MKLQRVQVQSWNISGLAVVNSTHLYCTLSVSSIEDITKSFAAATMVPARATPPGTGQLRRHIRTQSPNYPPQALTSCLFDDKETCKNTDVGAFCFLCHLLSQLCEILFRALAFMPRKYACIFLQSLRTQGGTCREMPAPVLRWMNSQVQTLHTILTFPFKLHSSQVCQKPNGQRLTTSGLLIHVKVVHPHA